MALHAYKMPFIIVKVKGGSEVINLQKIRVKAGMTQEQLAEKCHVVRQTIGEIERGVNTPSIPTAKKIGEVLGFDWTEFFD